jgi:hypothetical protein
MRKYFLTLSILFFAFSTFAQKSAKNSASSGVAPFYW